MTNPPFDYTVADFNCIEDSDGPRRRRLFMQAGPGPFPLVVDLHGGAWCSQDLRDGGIPRSDSFVLSAAPDAIVSSAGVASDAMTTTPAPSERDG
jgi:acetyl esterase/lipase